jgi:hypothetical protein
MGAEERATFRPRGVEGERERACPGRLVGAGTLLRRRGAIVTVDGDDDRRVMMTVE